MVYGATLSIRVTHWMGMRTAVNPAALMFLSSSPVKVFPHAPSFGASNVKAIFMVLANNLLPSVISMGLLLALTALEKRRLSNIFSATTLIFAVIFRWVDYLQVTYLR